MDVSLHDWSLSRNHFLHIKEILSGSEVPTWPDKLEEIELIQLTQLSKSAMKSILGSLVEAAPRLSELRRLTISAILKIGWRDRAMFRERWTHRLEAIFLRRTAPPNPNLRSLRKRCLHSTQAVADGESAPPGSAGSEPPTPSKRQSVRLAQHKDASSLSSSPSSNEDIHQGTCDVVNIRIDNQRPAMWQFDENDFLDIEPSDDEDWAGDDWEPSNQHAW